MLLLGVRRREQEKKKEAQIDSTYSKKSLDTFENKLPTICPPCEAMPHINLSGFREEVLELLRHDRVPPAGFTNSRLHLVRGICAPFFRILVKQTDELPRLNVPPNFCCLGGAHHRMAAIGAGVAC